MGDLLLRIFWSSFARHFSFTVNHIRVSAVVTVRQVGLPPLHEPHSAPFVPTGMYQDAYFLHLTFESSIADIFRHQILKVHQDAPFFGTCFEDRTNST